MHQSLRQRTVVRQKQQALGIEIQAAYREHTLRQILDKIGNAAAVLRIGHCRHHSTRLVEQVIGLCLLRHRLAVDADTHSCSIKLAAQLGNNLAVDTDAACGNYFFCFAAGGNTCSR